MAGRKKKKEGKKKRRPGRQGPVPAPARLPGNPIVIPAPPGEQKMSEVILDFVAPYLPTARTPSEIKGLISVATLAWNAAMFPPSERAEIVQKLVDPTPPDLQQEMRGIVEGLIKRKDTHFADNKRIIVNYQLTDTPTGVHIDVMSTPSWT